MLLAVGAAAVFVVAAVSVALTEQQTWVRVASILWLLVAIGALLEVCMARVDMLSDQLVIRSVLGTARVPYIEITSVKLEDGQLHFKLRNSSWRHLPGWLSGVQAQSARVQLTKRLKVAP